MQITKEMLLFLSEILMSNCIMWSRWRHFLSRLLVNEEHPLAARESVTIQDLKGEPLYIESSQFYIYHLITGKCQEAGFEREIVFQTSGFSLCHKMVKMKKGISVTVDFVYEDMAGSGLKLIPFQTGNTNGLPACLQEKKRVRMWRYNVSAGIYRIGL